jgi:1-acyl-sn-glycerol-3-phosphate acyltransferase
MSFPRVALGLPLAGLFLGVFGPPRRLAQARGLRWGRSTPVMFHRLLCAMLRVQVRRLGAPSAAGPRLIVSNHVSWLDIPILASLEPMTFLAKKEIGGPFLGRQLANLQGVVYVDRQRKRTIPQVNADMAAAMRAGEPVVLFAEATTGDGVRLLRFRSSHFEAARTAGGVVQPVYMHFKRLGGLALARRDMPRVAWYGDMTFLPHLWAFLAGGALECDVHFGAPIRVADFSDRKVLTRAAEAAMRRLAEAARRTHA